MKPHNIPPHRLLTVSVVCFVLFLIAMALIFSGCASSRLGKSLNVAVVGAATADYVSTRAAINSGRGHEANWFGDHALAQAVVKVAGASGAIWMAGWVEHKHPVLSHVIRGAAITAWSLAAIHNERIRR